MFATEWLQILACPWCANPASPAPAPGRLSLEGPPEAPRGLRCQDCGRYYKIEAGLANLLVDEAELPAAAKS